MLRNISTAFCFVLLVFGAVWFGAPSLAVAKGVGVSEGSSTLLLACSSPPEFHFENMKGKTAGKVSEVFDRWFQGLDMTVELYHLPRQRGILGASHGKFDGLCTCTSDESIPDGFTVSSPIGFAPVGLLLRNTRRKSANIHSVQKSNMIFATVSGDNLDDFAQLSNINVSARLETYRQGIRMLELKRIDAMLVRKSSYMRLKDIFTSDMEFDFVELSRSTLHLCMVSPKGKALISHLNALLERGLFPPHEHSGKSDGSALTDIQRLEHSVDYSTSIKRAF